MGLCIGTVQFGMHYGIASTEHPTPEKSIEILEYAAQAGIRAIDTASSYGRAEEIVGKFLKHKNRSDFHVISKIKPDALSGISSGGFYDAIKKSVETSLEKLNTDYLDGCLFHNPDYVYNPEALGALSRLKQDKIARKTGVSVYLPEELDEAMDSADVDLVQIPLNILDQRMMPQLAEKKPSLAVHARSAFLQGLLLMQEKDIPSHLSGIVPYLRQMDDYCEKWQISKNALLLAFMRFQKNINEIVFGVDSLQHLKQIIADYNTKVNQPSVLELAKQFGQVEDYILRPNLWKGDNK